MVPPTTAHAPPQPRPCDQAVQNHARDSLYFYRLVAYVLGDAPPRPLVSRGMHPFTRRLLAHAYRTTARRARAARPPQLDVESDDNDDDDDDDDDDADSEGSASDSEYGSDSDCSSGGGGRDSGGEGDNSAASDRGPRLCQNSSPSNRQHAGGGVVAPTETTGGDQR